MTRRQEAAVGVCSPRCEIGYLCQTCRAKADPAARERAELLEERERIFAGGTWHDLTLQGLAAVAAIDRQLRRLAETSKAPPR